MAQPITRHWTPEQRIAIETDNRLIVVSAGAGAGKTAVLAERFVRLVTERDVDVERILTITYTRKAAAEMQHRIRHALTARGREDAARRLDQASIGTIDAFCSRLLRENPLDTGLPPDLRQLSEYDAARLFHQAFSRVVDRIARDPEYPAGPLLRDAFGRGAARELGTGLASLRRDIWSVLQTLRAWGLTRAELDGWIRHWTDTPPDLPTRLLPLMRTSLIAPLAASINLATPGTPWHSDASRLQRALEADQPWTPDCLRLRAQGIPQTPAARDLTERLRDWMGVWRGAEVADELPSARMALRLLADLWDEYATVRREQGAMDFAEVLETAVNLLATCPAVRDRYRRRFAYVMLDEYQDANPLQQRLVSLIMRGDNLFVVGDVQQSIYGFRHAAPELLQQMEDEASHRGSCLVRLADNFRSRPGILVFTHRVFGALWPPESSRRPGNRLRPLTAAARFDTPERHPVRLLSIPSPVDTDRQTAMAEAVAGWVRRALDHGVDGTPVRCGDIALLFRTTAYVGQFERAFAAAGIPFYNTARRSYYERFEVRDLVLALRLIDTPGDDLTLAAVLRSPLGDVDLDTLLVCAQARPADGTLWDAVCAQYGSLPGLAPARPLLEALFHLQTTDTGSSAAAAIRVLLDTVQYETRLLCRPDGRQRVANVRKLLQMALAEPETPPYRFAEAMGDLERIAIREGDAPLLEQEADVARFYTIHASKGLEFPVVILPDIDTPVTRRRAETPVLGAVAQHQFIACSPQGSTPGMQALSIWQRDTDRDETTRVWYVACTRAIQTLVLPGFERSRNSWWSTFVSALGLELPLHPGPVARYPELMVEETPALASHPMPAEDEVSQLLRQWMGSAVPAEREALLHRILTGRPE